MNSWPCRRVGALAARQRGLLTRGQLLSLDVSSGAIRNALDAGRIYRVHQGIYAVLPVPALPALAREQAAILACGPPSFISHHSAAALLGIRPARAGEIELTVIGRDRGRRRPGLIVHRVMVLDRRETRSHEGIPVTSAARTLVDIAVDLTEHELELAINEALVRKLMTVWQLGHVLDRYPNRSGTARIRAQLRTDRPAGAPRPGAEALLLPHLIASGLPTPLVNHRLGPWQPDLYWPDAKLAVEIDGLDFHSTRPRLERDHRKDLSLRMNGIESLRFTGRQVRRELALVLVTIAREYERRVAV